MLKDEILEQAIEGTSCTSEWAAMQTVRIYREHVAAGMEQDDAIQAAKEEMEEIAAWALRVRKIRRREQILEAVAPWCVIVLGAAACVGWWYLWE